MAERYEFARALGRQDACNLGAGQHVALGQGLSTQKLHGLRSQRHHGFGNGPALRGGLAAHIDHAETPPGIQMGK